MRYQIWFVKLTRITVAFGVGALLLASANDVAPPQRASGLYLRSPMPPEYVTLPIGEDGQGRVFAPGSEGAIDSVTSGAAVAAYLKRAWPAEGVPFLVKEQARQAFRALVSSRDGQPELSNPWVDLGPSHAQFPAILTFTGAKYVTSGRITALAIDPNCSTQHCRLFVGAAGGGLW